eukprot:GHVU01218054.1.p1 GENE.GHVU01218054.1~~GHVU01218054.1.p1  ORF type:complete len:254 (-),score=20.21 GHVU01218054.1:1229-1990(-)
MNQVESDFEAWKIPRLRDTGENSENPNDFFWILESSKQFPTPEVQGQSLREAIKQRFGPDVDFSTFDSEFHKDLAESHFRGAGRRSTIAQNRPYDLGTGRKSNAAPGKDTNKDVLTGKSQQPRAAGEITATVTDLPYGKPFEGGVKPMTPDECQKLREDLERSTMSLLYTICSMSEHPVINMAAMRKPALDTCWSRKLRGFEQTFLPLVTGQPPGIYLHGRSATFFREPRSYGKVLCTGGHASFDFRVAGFKV